jgi:hypothetical protein
MMLFTVTQSLMFFEMQSREEVFDRGNQEGQSLQERNKDLEAGLWQVGVMWNGAEQQKVTASKPPVMQYSQMQCVLFCGSNDGDAFSNMVSHFH